MTDIPEYDDLKLRIEAGDGDSYRVVAFGPGGNTATGRFARPISQVELDNFILQGWSAAPARSQVPLIADGGGEAARHAAVREPLRPQTWVTSTTAPGAWRTAAAAGCG